MTQLPHSSSAIALLTIVILAIVPDCLSAQRVRGRVVEEGTGVGVSFARVELVRDDTLVVAVTTADTAGFFLLQVTPGTYRLRTDRFGYAGWLSDAVTVGQGQTVTVTLRMAARGIPLDPIEARAGGYERGRFGFDRRRALGKGWFLTPDSIKARSAVVASDAFWSIPGIEVTDARDPSVSSWYGAKCLVLLVDHQNAPLGSMVATGAGQGLTPSSAGGMLNLLVGVSSIRGIEVYRNKSEIPRELQTVDLLMLLWRSRRADYCGLGLVWTAQGW
jgi:hypothetical protein